MSRTYGLSEWREDVKTVLKKAGLGEQHVVFLFADTQVNYYVDKFTEVSAVYSSLQNTPTKYK